MADWQQGKFKTRDGLQLHYRYFLHPSAEDTLIIHHGHGEHSARYEKFANYLAAQNLNLAIYDARGHGLSEGERVYINSLEDFIGDLSNFVSFLEEQYGLKKKFYLLGHSNGALVSIHWVMRDTSRLKGLFLSSPYLGLDLPAPLLWMNACFNLLCPHLIYKNPVYPPYLTHNLAEVENYKKDTLIQRKISVRLLSEMLLYQRKLRAVPAFEFPFPVYILAAGLERVVRSSDTLLFFEKLRVPEKALKEFPDFYHEIFNELGQEKVFEAFNTYISAAKKFASA